MQNGELVNWGVRRKERVLAQSFRHAVWLLFPSSRCFASQLVMVFVCGWAHNSFIQRERVRLARSEQPFVFSQKSTTLCHLVMCVQSKIRNSLSRYYVCSAKNPQLSRYYVCSVKNPQLSVTLLCVFSQNSTTLCHVVMCVQSKIHNCLSRCYVCSVKNPQLSVTLLCAVSYTHLTLPTKVNV